MYLPLVAANQPSIDGNDFGVIWTMIKIHSYLIEGFP
jgi:hypothetical protein